MNLLGILFFLGNGQVYLTFSNLTVVTCMIDELSGFNEAWNGSARNHMPGSTGNFIGHNNMGMW